MHTITNLRLRFLSLFLLAIPLMLQAQEEAAEEAVGSGGQSLWGLIMQGGWAMWPLGLCCLAVIFLTIYCYRETARKKFIPDAILPQVSAYLQARQVAEASQTLSTQPSMLSRLLNIGLQKARPDWPDANKAKIELVVGESLEAEENTLGQWVNYLNVVAAVAPMIGLLGTVSGMISAFQTISQGGMGRPELLAGDIGEALITTATGLVIGIPAMVCYFIMKNRLGSMIIATAQTASNLIDELAGEHAAVEYVEAEEE